jgi:rhodanese-related sulfurtransferase
MPFQTLQPAEALAFIQKADALVLDVRTPDEFATGHLPMALNMPVDSIPQKLDKIPTNKTLVIYCEHGSRSKLAANFLAGRGYQKVYHIQGGFANLAPLL